MASVTAELLLNLRKHAFECRPTLGTLVSWADFWVSVKQLYSVYFTSEYVETQFELPGEVADFLKTAEGVYYRKGEVGCLYDREEVLKMVSYHLNVWKPQRTDVMWMPLGLWMIEGSIIACCDKESSQFGSILEIRDGHPWGGPEYIQAGFYNSFLTYARNPD